MHVSSPIHQSPINLHLEESSVTRVRFLVRTLIIIYSPFQTGRTDANSSAIFSWCLLHIFIAVRLHSLGKREAPSVAYMALRHPHPIHGRLVRSKLPC